jgi:5-oxopent-3-ene-1,2,5-tricarboxylate decarboxylase/2-hydroxyhepta-2,4-diene-1,7-dioate isomerase
MTHHPTRTVVGAMFEFQSAWDAAAPTMAREPHLRPPVHPVLYIKPANTWAADGSAVMLPAGVDEVEVGATLGIAFARAASRVRVEDALSCVAGYVVVNDVTVPHASLLRPPMKHKCRDGFCPIGGGRAAAEVGDPSRLVLRAGINGRVLAQAPLAELRRDVARLIADVSDFMTLAPGDLLLVGVPAGMPRARAGDTMFVEVDGVGRVENTVRREGGA